MRRARDVAAKYWHAIDDVVARHGEYIRDELSPVSRVVVDAYTRGVLMRDNGAVELDVEGQTVTTVKPWMERTTFSRSEERHVPISTASLVMDLTHTIYSAPPVDFGVVLYRGEVQARVPVAGDVATHVLPWSATWSSPFAELFPAHKPGAVACCTQVIRIAPRQMPMLVLYGLRGHSSRGYSSHADTFQAAEVILPPCTLRVAMRTDPEPTRLRRGGPAS